MKNTAQQSVEGSALLRIGCLWGSGAESSVVSVCVIGGMPRRCGACGGGCDGIPRNRLPWRFLHRRPPHGEIPEGRAPLWGRAWRPRSGLAWTGERRCGTHRGQLLWLRNGRVGRRLGDRPRLVSGEQRCAPVYKSGGERHGRSSEQRSQGARRRPPRAGRRGRIAGDHRSSTLPCAIHGPSVEGLRAHDRMSSRLYRALPMSGGMLPEICGECGQLSVCQLSG
jgi:hypothetical protein